MSTFDDLDDAAKFQRLRHLAIAGFQMGMNSFAVLISRGLVSPDEFSTLMNPVLDILEDVKSKGDDNFLASSISSQN